MDPKFPKVDQGQSITVGWVKHACYFIMAGGDKWLSNLWGH